MATTLSVKVFVQIKLRDILQEQKKTRRIEKSTEKRTKSNTKKGREKDEG